MISTGNNASPLPQRFANNEVKKRGGVRCPSLQPLPIALARALFSSGGK
jgi:hypothetical protein